MNEHQLTADIFSEADQEYLVGFSCGDSAVGRAGTEWILGTDVLESVQRGSTVWIYYNQIDEIVGFGSLGPIHWRWPLPDGTYTNLLIIPMIGIDKRFQGCPPSKEWRYSHQIMNHLIFEARQMAAEAAKPIEWLLLLVQPNNRRAIKLYEDFDFEIIPDVSRGPANSMVIKHRLAS